MAGIADLRWGKCHTPPRLLVYGGEGVGKSTFAAGATDPVFIPTEDGLGEIDCTSFPKAETYNELMSSLMTLTTEEHKFGTVIIDTVTNLERLIHEDLCRGAKVKSIELVGGGFGRGHTMAVEKLGEVLLALDGLRTSRGMVVVLIAHAKVESFADPEGPAYDRWVPRLHKAFAGRLVEWADIVGLASKRIRIAESESTSRNKATPIGKNGGERVLKTMGGPAAIGKSRYAMPGELPLAWSEFELAITKGLQNGSDLV